MMPRSRRFGLLLTLVATAWGCSGGADVSLLECQLAVQKGNAGHSDQDREERAREVASCMEQRGFRRALEPAACRDTVTRAECYRAR